MLFTFFFRGNFNNQVRKTTFSHLCTLNIYVFIWLIQYFSLPFFSFFSIHVLLNLYLFHSRHVVLFLSSLFIQQDLRICSGRKSLMFFLNIVFVGYVCGKVNIGELTYLFKFCGFSIVVFQASFSASFINNI